MVKCTNVGGSQEGEVENLKKQHKEEGTSWVNNGG